MRLGAFQAATRPAVRVAGPSTHARQAPSPARTSVVAHGRGKGKSRMRQGGGRQMMRRPPTPEVDPANEEFVVFARAKKLPRWIPMTIVKGGTQANLLVKAMQGNLGKEFYTKTLINNMGQAVYAEREKIEQQIRAGMPGYEKFTDFEFGFKIRNKEKPESWLEPDGVILLPPEEEIPKGAFEGFKDAMGTAMNFNKS